MEKSDYDILVAGLVSLLSFGLILIFLLWLAKLILKF